MASTDNTILDDPIAGDGDDSFTGGQVSSAQESAIPKGGFFFAQNMDFDPFGRLETRRGARTTAGNVETRTWDTIATNWNALTTYFGNNLGSTPVDACTYFATYVTQYIVIAQGGVLKQGTESAVYAGIGGSSYSGTKVYFAQIANRLYYCDGVGALKYIDSALSNNSISAGRVTSLTVTNQGSGYIALPAITFSSGAATATSILGYGGRLIGATITAPGAGYSSTTPPTATVAAAPSTGTNATVRVNITQTPSQPCFLTANGGRLFCSTTDTTIPPDTLYVSDILDGESWDLLGSSLRVGGDGDPITGIYSWFGSNVLVFKQRSIWMVQADPLVPVANWNVQIVNNRIGCVSHKSIQGVGSDVYFLAQDGVRSMSKIQAGTQTDVGQTLSAPIQDQIDNINKAAFSSIASAFYRNRYFLAVPTGANTTPDTVYVWNELTKSWMGSWTGWAPRDFCVTGFSGRLRLNFADNTGKFWTWDDYTAVSSETTSQFQDDTSTYESYVVTRAYDCQEPLVDKLLHGVQVFSENRMTDSAVTAYLYLMKDIAGTWTALDTNIVIQPSDRQKRVVKNLISRGKANVWQFKFGATRWKIALPAIATTAFVDPLKTELSTA